MVAEVEGRLVDLVEESHRGEQQPHPGVQGRVKEKIQCRKLQRYRAILDLDLAVPHQPVVELVADVENGAQRIDLVLVSALVAHVGRVATLRITPERDPTAQRVDLRRRGTQSPEALEVLVRERTLGSRTLQLVGQRVQLALQLGDSILLGEFHVAGPRSRGEPADHQRQSQAQQPDGRPAGTAVGRSRSGGSDRQAGSRGHFAEGTKA